MRNTSAESSLLFGLIAASMLLACGGNGSNEKSTTASATRQNVEVNEVLRRTAQLNALDLQVADANVYAGKGSTAIIAPKESQGLSAVYRFYNKQTSAHLYTINLAEKTNIETNIPQLQLEGVAFYASLTPAVGLSPVYRFMNSQTGVHFYSISESEKNAILASLPQFRYEGVAYYASMVQTQDTVPLYRFYQSQKGFHFYTTNWEESESIKFKLPQYLFEQTAYHVFKSEPTAFLSRISIVSSELEVGRITTFKLSEESNELSVSITRKPSGSIVATNLPVSGGVFSFAPDLEGEYAVTLGFRGATRSESYFAKKLIAFDSANIVAGSGLTPSTGLIANQFTLSTSLTASQVAIEISSKYPHLTLLGVRGSLVHIQADPASEVAATELDALKLNSKFKYFGQRLRMDVPRSQYMPNDGSAFGDLGDNWHLEDIGIVDAWDMSKSGTRGNPSVKIVVGDDYLHVSHEEIVNRHSRVVNPVVSEEESTEFDHGTMVVSTIGGEADNGVGVSGVNHFASVDFVSTRSNNISNGYELAEAVCPEGSKKVVNLSISLLPDPLETINPVTGLSFLEVVNPSGEEMLAAIARHREVSMEHERRLFNYSYRNWMYVREFVKRSNCLFVISAGNDFVDAKFAAGAIHYEVYSSSETNMNTVELSKLPNVMVVGAYRKNHHLANYSNYGESVDIAAPTEFKAATTVTTNIFGSQRSNYTENGGFGAGGAFRGTSAAAPLVAGVASLLLSKYPDFDAAKVKDILIRSARSSISLRDVDSNDGANNTGESLPSGSIPKLDAKSAMALAAQETAVPPAVGFSASLASPKVGEVVTFTPNAKGHAGRKIVSYNWTFGDGFTTTTAVGSSVTHAYARAGLFRVQLRVVDESGGVNVAQGDISVMSVPVAPSLSINFDPGSLTLLGADTDESVVFIQGRNSRYAAKFGGVNNPGSIRIPNSSKMQFTTGATFDLWARVDSMVGMNGYATTVHDGQFAAALIAKSHDQDGVGMMVNSMADPNSSIWTASFSETMAGNCMHHSSPVIPIGTWTRVTYTFSAATGIRGYLNKSLVWECSGARPSFTSMNQRDLYIGKFSDYWYPLDGAVQDIRIYQRALTAEEVLSLQ